ncbi:MAG: N-6 DNA methylase [Planctomycetes bacterium]|nr:N-6 DNA methylase [Planctomycetota bacterium]
MASDYTVGDTRFPLVGFAGKPWDHRSTCIAVVEANGDPAAAVKSCYDLGAPIVWVRHNRTVDWWTQHAVDPTRLHSAPASQFPKLVRQHKDDLDPVSVYRAKTLGRLPGEKQLDFVDIGLMPLLERRAGEKLGGLVEEMIRAVFGELKNKKPSKKRVREVFTAVFRLLAGKILKDKKVRGFANLDLREPLAVLEAVCKHYNSADQALRMPREWGNGLAAASELTADFGNVRVVSPETLAYVYEHTLVTKDIRNRLGIHATPPYLVDYIVWQLYDWICEIPSAERHVYEPACGHAPFLLAAMRMLRMEMQGEPDRKVHTYLKHHIHGVDVDDFALEIARLSLTLADVPNPNGWDLQSGDMYASNVLADETKRCRILLSNPPYERFSDAERNRCRRAGFPVQHRKAVELLTRTLKHLAPGAVFGVVVPQGVLQSKEARGVRTLLLRDFEIREVCLFADKVFEEGDAETAVILGRRRVDARTRATQVTFRRVREESIARFAENYSVDSEHTASMAQLDVHSDKHLYIPDLPEVWAHISGNPALGIVADIGEGFSFAQEGLIEKARTAGRRQTSDALPAYLTGVGKLSIWEIPKQIWLSPKRTPVYPWRSGDHTGKPQVLVNHARVMRGPWRIKALLDPSGRAVIKKYVTVRPREGGPKVIFLWALLNSPMANAYVHCHTFRRDIYVSLVASFPLPGRWQDHVASVVAAAEAYLKLVREPEGFALQTEQHSVVCDALLNMDAAVMRAYGLPLRLERAVLDLFRLPQHSKQRRRRKGVGCVFGEYFPGDFKSLVPLHKYISAAYRRTTVEEVAARMRPGESRAVLSALRIASDAFGEGS